MAESDHRRALTDGYENAAVIVSGISAEQVAHPTPCAGYDVAGLIDHLVEAGRRAAALGRGQVPPPGDVSAHIELGDAPAALRQAGEEAARAWGEDAALSSTLTMPWGQDYTGAMVVDMYVTELAGHAWDLARATGQLSRLDPALPGPALQGARELIRPEWRNLAGQGSPFGAEVPPPPGGDDWERFAAFIGRDPRALPGSRPG